MSTRSAPKPRLRVLLGAAIAMGPGKADLLDAIAKTGSISKAAREMGMSYRRAWLLVDAMNASFKEPLVGAARGGKGGGGAKLTAFGAEALGRYRSMEGHASQARAEEMAEFTKMLKDQDEGPEA
jgi:molybdate transport system regulatory protein